METNNNPQVTTSPQKNNGKYWIVFIVLFVVTLVFLQGTKNNEARPQTVVNETQLNKIYTFSGNESGQSEEFTINGENVKIVYTCKSGDVVCTVRLRQVGGELNKEVFRSRGGSGDITGEIDVQTGPGTFYFTADTSNRSYTVEVFQDNSIPLNEKAVTESESKFNDTAIYRNLNGFKLEDETIFDQDWSYTYNVSDGNKRYQIRLFVSPQDSDIEFDPEFTLDRNNTTINNNVIDYAYAEQVFSNPLYSGLQFIFDKKEKSYSGYISVKPSNPDKQGLNKIMNDFITSLTNALDS